MTPVNMDVDGIAFHFPSGWSVEKGDDWAFYRKQFLRLRPGLKAVDLLALCPEDPRTLWLIEVKDYRGFYRKKTISLDEEMAGKVVGTLAMLLPAKLHATHHGENVAAGRFLTARELRVVLHLEQPTHTSAFYPKNRLINPSNVLMELRKKMKAVDPHPEVVDSTATFLPWLVTL